MYQPYRSGGHRAGPLRPAAPAPVLTAVRLMHAGAAVSAICLIISLAVAVDDIGAPARGRWLGYSLTAARLGQLKPVIVTVVMAGGLVVIALWLWMARANGRGRSWARIFSTVLSGMAALQMADYLGRPSVHAVSGVEVVAVLAWLPGLAAVWLLWRPACAAFFRAAGPGGGGALSA